MEHEGNITPPTYPKPRSVAQFSADLMYTGGEKLCCNCCEVCHLCNDEVDEKPEKAAKKSAPKKDKKGDE